MKLKKYLVDKLIEMILLIGFMIMTMSVLLALKLQTGILILYFFLCILFFVPVILSDYLKKRSFYRELLTNIERLDKKYLVLDTLNEPSFYEGQLICHAMYEINKSMCENVKKYELNVNSFKDYLEMWVHEVKIPIASLLLMCHNHSVDVKKYKEQLRRMDFYTDQVLYYVRCEHAENDYIIKEVELDRVINESAQKNREDFLAGDVALKVENVDMKVMTDKKWLEFILNQIINNSIKYKANNRESYIHIYAEDFKDKTVLHIRDNGIGIAASDLPNVFKKSFTGENGRKHAKSTGMGLYIAKMLCDRLGHKVEVLSEQSGSEADDNSESFTELRITFVKNDFYKVR